MPAEKFLPDLHQITFDVEAKWLLPWYQNEKKLTLGDSDDDAFRRGGGHH